MNYQWLPLCVVLASASPFIAPGRSHAQDRPVIRHRVASGDTFELLAAEYYGDRRHAVFILKANNLTHPRPLRRREVIKIPMNRRITAKAGDTLFSLANQHLGDKRRAEFLAEFNNLSTEASIAVGQSIVIPVTVRHKAAGKEDLASIAAAYFGNRKKARLLKRYNFLSDDLLQSGGAVIIPLNHVRVQASKLPPPDPESAARVQKRAEMQKMASDLWPTIEAASRRGNYGLVRRELAAIETEYLDAELAIQIGIELGTAYTAFGDDDLALLTFKNVLERAPDTELSTYQHSPKVRDIWIRAGGAAATQ